LFLTRKFYHPKILWFRGVGAYVGSANLTDNGWTGNLECGVWFDQQDLLRLGWGTSLSSMFDVIARRSTEATEEHLRAYESLRSATSALEKQKAMFTEAAAKALKTIPGAEPPLDPTARRGGGAAKAAFMSQWNNGLTLLRKMTKMVAAMPKPSWIAADSPPSIVQDQATEGWYHDHIRSTGESLAQIEKLHAQNRTFPEAVTRTILEGWLANADPERFAEWVNESPKTVHNLLQRNRVRSLSRDDLARVLYLAHASREHARQIRNETLGLPREAHTPQEERCGLYSDLLLSAVSDSGRTIHDVLEYVLWGDGQTGDCAERIWNAVYLPEWSLPHLGVSTLGELIGYARPGEFPPRNGRVSKTLYALGYEGISW
jgi:hypothetical protein